MYKKECKWCGELIEVEKQPLFALHVANCKSNPSFEKKKLELSIRYKGKLKSERIKLEKACPKCGCNFEIVATESEIKRGKTKKFCSRKCGNSRNLSNETKNKISTSLKGNIPHNKGNKKIYESICQKCNLTIFSEKYIKNRKYHKECWLSISGGVRKGSSRGKSGWYKGFWCDSSYELAYLIYCLEHSIEIKRNKEGFEYEFKNKKHLFYPDFMVENRYVEIKNFESDLTDAKIYYFPHEIKVIYKKDIKPFLNYTIERYGKDFISLYER
jgi:hypothetical protein